jgi:hypothetical protein
MVTLFRDDHSGVSKKLTVGKYTSSQLGIGNDMLSSIEVPRGLQVTLYEHDAFQGRSAVLRGNANTNFFVSNAFNDVTSSVIVEEVYSTQPTVTVYTDNFDGGAQSLTPGRYALKDLEFGGDQISSARVPPGMRLTLFEQDGFKGQSLTAERDIDLTVSKSFDNRARSLVVEDLFVPIVTPVESPVVTPTVAVPVVTTPATTTGGGAAPTNAKPADCEMNSTQFDNARKAIEAKGFRDEKMSTAKLATRNRCLTLDQTRSIASLFMDDDQRLEFVKYAYELCDEKREYYLLEDVFQFSSTRELFTKFLQSK